MKLSSLLPALSLWAAVPAFAANPLLDNLVAYWDFEGGTANHASATGGTAYNGSLLGNASTSGTSKVGTGALLMDGNGDYMDVTANVNVNQPWAVSAWFRTTVASAGAARQSVYESVGTPTSVGYTMSYGLREGSPTTSTAFQLFCDNTAPTADVSASKQVPDASVPNTWYHIVTIFKPATPTEAGSLTGYLNGVQDYNLVIPVNTTVVAADGFHLGTYRLADGRWFSGSIDEVAIWNRALTPTEAAEVYTRGTQGDTLTEEKITVALSATPPGSGSVSGSGIYELNEAVAVAVAATPNPGYVFSAWDGGFTGQPASFTYTATANITATATFAQDTTDSDGDGLSNYQEIVTYGTLPGNPDTDGDQIPDGAEVQTTFTNPLSSDAALVNFVEENLCEDNAGAIAMSPVEIQRDPLTGNLSLRVSFEGSADRSLWQAVDLNSPSVSIVPSGSGWLVTLPAPSNTVDSYLLLGRKP
jgi:hypothetical protein